MGMGIFGNSDRQLIGGLAVSCICGSLLLLNFNLFGEYQILLGDMMSYVSIVNLGGIAVGFAYIAAIPDTMYSSDYIAFFYIWFDTLGRVPTPPLVRTILA